MATAIDTLKIYERLKSADITDKAAKEIAEVLQDVVVADLVTKDELDKALSRQTADIVKWVAAMLVAQAAVIAALTRLFSH
ncbi:MAG: DUF1640 domain-containing protein [Nitrospirae bacterium]|nr:DUF1640 domain-containing protein [Nitrospirota bacterium]